MSFVGFRKYYVHILLLTMQNFPEWLDFYKVVAVVGSSFRSIYNGKTEYKLGKMCWLRSTFSAPTTTITPSLSFNLTSVSLEEYVRFLVGACLLMCMHAMCCIEDCAYARPCVFG